jgi:hypothetical protein
VHPEAADALFFCATSTRIGRSRRPHLARRARRAIVAAGRFTLQRAQRLLDDIWAGRSGAALPVSALA